MKLLRSPIVAHIAAWLLFGTLVIGFVYRGPVAGQWQKGLPPLSVILFFGYFIALFYVNSLLLLPRLYLKAKRLWYAVSILLLFILTFYLCPFDRMMNDVIRRREQMIINNAIGSGDRWPEPPPPDNWEEERGPKRPAPDSMVDQKPFRQQPGFTGQRRNLRRGMRDRDNHIDIASIIVFIAMWSLSTALYIIRLWRLTEERAVRAEAEKTQAELSFLKAQINPHFLFNTLNNIYSLAISQNPHTADSILKLSNIMRYVTDDIREDFVLLEHEIECMKDYIDLQRLRLGNKMQVHFDVNGNPVGRTIVPLVLMTFIENVFKYGISSHEPSEIRIGLDIKPDSIHFYCRNRVHRKGGNETRKGVGIANTQQRLQHLYPGKYALLINEENGFYTVDLSIIT